MSKSIIETARFFASKGVSCIPVHDFHCEADPNRSKAPAVDGWREFQNRAPSEEEIESMFGGHSESIALIAGKIHCLDLDEKYNDKEQPLIEQLRERCEEAGLADVFNLALCQSTPSGGHHLIFRCKDVSDRNEKLACLPGEGRKKNAIFETRGSGGYFLIHPSRGYSIEQGFASDSSPEVRPNSFEGIPLFSKDEKDALYDVCRSFDRCGFEKASEPSAAAPVTYSSTPSDLTPGEDFDNRANADPSMIATLLRNHGWSQVGKHHWCRPGKKHGISATLGAPEMGGGAVFYVFSTSTEFDTETVYKPWHTFAVLECGGDFKRAAGLLRQAGFGGQLPERTNKPDRHQASRSDDDSGYEPQPMESGRPDGKSAASASFDEMIDDGSFDLDIKSREEDEAAKYDEASTVIDGLLYRGATCMLSAPSKSRKTWTQIDLAVAVAAGADWMGLETTKTNVLYVNFELFDFETRQRRRAIETSRCLRPEGLFVLNLRGKRGGLRKIKRSLIETIKRKDIGLLILDPIYLAMLEDGGDENSVRDVLQFLWHLEDIATEGNCAVVYAHHFAKGDSSEKDIQDRGAGSGVHARKCDAQIVMTPAPRGGPYSENQCGKLLLCMEFINRSFAPIRPRVVEWIHPAWELAPINPASFFEKKAKGR